MSTCNSNIIQPNQNSPPSKVKLIIHNQSPGIELVSPVYCSDGAECYLPPNQRVDFGFTTQVYFIIDLDQESIGSLMYKLQRKNIGEFSEKTMSSKDEATCIQLFIAWNVNNSREFCIYSCLIEHDKGHIWDRDRLMKLAKHYKLFDMQHGLIEETWLIHDNTALMTSLNVIREEECYKLEMTISSIKDGTQRPLYIDLNR
jgi:hypothetical protein